MPLNAYQWSDDPDDIVTKFFPLVSNVNGNSSWYFSHCLPWEYAGLCIGILKAHLANHDFVIPNEGTNWNPQQCTLPDPNKHPLMGIADWESLSAPPDEIVRSHREGVLPKRIEDRAELAMWVITRQVCDAKSLDFNDDSFSSFLYIHVSYLYRIGFGEAYIVELMTITTLSFFLFYTSFLGEAQQLMYQVTLCSILRCYEDRIWSWTRWEDCAPSSQALRRKVEKKLARSRSSVIFQYLVLVIGDFLCDIFLSIRILFLAYMVMCTEMITTWVGLLFAESPDFV
jgi:hypothetical protein